MKWRIVGASRDTGEDIEITLDAPTPSAAEQRANQMGVLIERLEPDTPAPEIVPVVPEVAPLDQASRMAEATRVARFRPTVDAHTYPHGVQTIERTGKGWKLAMVVSVVMVLAGVAKYFTDDLDSASIGTLLMGLGATGFVGAKIGAWWCHG